VKYSAIVLEHVKNPRNVGELPSANAKARVRSSTDGDVLQLHLQIEEDVVKDARFKVYGCGAAIATGSMLTELVIGKNIREIMSISNQQISELMGGLPPQKVHCSVLAEEAIAEAIANWKSQNHNQSL
jgi:nitrogen fixation protein NifU and related proteins